VGDRHDRHPQHGPLHLHPVNRRLSPILLHPLRALARNRSFYLLLLPFAVYVGFFNAFSSLINQILSPYAFSETESGIAGALLIFVGLFASAVISPLIDRTAAHRRAIKLLVPLIAAGYLILVFAPGTRSPTAVYIVSALIGAASFALLPAALEFAVEITRPVPPEVSSTVCWALGQLLGAVFVLVMDALRGQGRGQGGGGKRPEGNMWRALVFQAVLCWVVVPLPLMLGWVGDSSRRARDGAEERTQDELVE